MNEICAINGQLSYNIHPQISRFVKVFALLKNEFRFSIRYGELLIFFSVRQNFEWYQLACIIYNS